MKKSHCLASLPARVTTPSPPTAFSTKATRTDGAPVGECGAQCSQNCLMMMIIKVKKKTEI